MKRNLLFILVTLLANVLFAQSFVEITPASDQIAVNASNTAGTSIDLNVKFYAKITLTTPVVTFYAPVDFTINTGASSALTTGAAQGTISSITPDNMTASGQKTVRVNIPSTAQVGQIFAITIAVTHEGATISSTTGITVSQVLPVTWSSFEAVQKEKNIALSWTTESEKDNSHFIVERSTNGINFSPIGEVKAAGYSNTTRKYQFEDTDANASVNYYRIQAISLEGTSDVSKVLSVVKKGSFDVKTFPTEQGARVQIGSDQNGEEATIQVINLNGQVISSKQIKIDASVTDTQIDFQEKGVLIINVKTDTKSVSKKLLK